MDQQNKSPRLLILEIFLPVSLTGAVTMQLLSVCRVCHVVLMNWDNLLKPVLLHFLLKKVNQCALIFCLCVCACTAWNRGGHVWRRGGGGDGRGRVFLLSEMDDLLLNLVVSMLFSAPWNHKIPLKLAGYWGFGPLWDERRGTRGWEEVWRRRHREGEFGHSGEDPKEPETRPLEREGRGEAIGYHSSVVELDVCVQHHQTAQTENMCTWEFHTLDPTWNGLKSSTSIFIGSFPHQVTHIYAQLLSSDRRGFEVPWKALIFLQGAVSGSVQASDRLMKELREIYRSQSYKTGRRADWRYPHA